MVIYGGIVVAFCDVNRRGADDAQRVVQGGGLTDGELTAPFEEILLGLVFFGHLGVGDDGDDGDVDSEDSSDDDDW